VRPAPTLTMSVFAGTGSQNEITPVFNRYRGLNKKKIRFLIFTRVVGLLYTQRGGEWALRTVEYYWITCKNQALRPIHTKGTPTLRIQYSNPHDQIKAVQRERYVFFIVRAENTHQACFTLITRPLTPIVPKEPVYLTVVTPPWIAKPNRVTPGRPV